MVRTVRWSQVSDHSREPASWSEFHVEDTAEMLDVKGQLWNISKSTILHEHHAPELRLLSGNAWRRWDSVQARPFGDLKIKVIHHASGDFPYSPRDSSA